MMTRRAFLVGAVPLGAWLGSNAWSHDQLASATRTLMDVSFWAWGGIGIASTISAGQSAFLTVAQARSKTAVEVFENVYAHAKPAGRLYALLGLRDLAPTRFAALLPASLYSTAILESIDGCIVDTDTEEKIASLISVGAWGIRPSSAEEMRRRLAAMSVSENPAK